MKVILNKQVHGSFSTISTTDKHLKKEFDLPFMPFIGLYICLGDYFEEKITSMYWVDDEKILYCNTEDDKEIYNACLEKEKHRDIDTIVNEYIEMGWERDK